MRSDSSCRAGDYRLPESFAQASRWSFVPGRPLCTNVLQGFLVRAEHAVQYASVAPKKWSDLDTVRAALFERDQESIPWLQPEPLDDLVWQGQLIFLVKLDFDLDGGHALLLSRRSV